VNEGEATETDSNRFTTFPQGFCPWGWKLSMGYDDSLGTIIANLRYPVNKKKPDRKT
jgi:hypothetical protein